jgi:hypothetical protein
VIGALGLGALVACAACATANVGSGDNEAGIPDGGGDGSTRADAQRDAPPFSDDGGEGDGGTCTPDEDEGFGNETCEEAVTKGNLTDAASSHLSIVANLWPAGDVDWFRVAFEDTADTAGVCDKFNIRIAFAQNPGARYLFDVVADDCTSQPSCAEGELPTGLTTFSYTDDANCPCVEAATPPGTDDNTHVCVDHSMVLRIKVYRVVGAAAICEQYELSIDNG